MKSYRRYGRRKRTTKRYIRKFRRPFKKRVRSAVYQMAELKNGVTYIDSSPQELYTANLVPTIYQGPGDNQRIGNKVFSRYFSINLEFRFVQGVNYSNQTTTIRIFIVWPRRASRQDAESLITSTNFPVYGLIDQDNWIVWRDVRFVLGDGTQNGTTLIKNWKFYKRFPCTLEYTKADDIIPVKYPYMILSSSQTLLAASYLLTGYMKMSYKDI